MNTFKTKNKIFIISMPIGNSEDISKRAVNALKNCNLIVCENVSAAKKKLLQYGIENNLSSVLNLEITIKKAIECLKRNNICLISDNGTPCISDPGAEFIEYFYNNNYPLSSIPGPCAVSSAFALSGYKGGFLFHGFLPIKENEIIKILNNLKEINYNLIFFESSKRILKTLNILKFILINREVKIVREISKIYEEVITLNLTNEINHLEILGEIVLIIKKN